MEAGLYALDKLVELTREPKFSSEINVGKMKSYITALMQFRERIALMRLREMNLERRINEIFTEAQDILESWFIRREAMNHTRPLHVIRKEMDFQRLARQIHSIVVDKIEPLYGRIQMYEDLALLKNPSNPTNQLHSVLIHKEDMAIKVKKIVGFEDDEETLISSLREETEELDVISITGMPGIGKTTLAWKIYNDQLIRWNFPTRIWVDINPLNFRSKDLYVSILKEFIKQDMIGHNETSIWYKRSQVSGRGDSYDDFVHKIIDNGEIDDHEIIRAVCACLEKTRFLLVIDDVWSKETLEGIKDSLPNTGKVIITSRINHVTSKSRVLRFLNEKESWELLQLEVFGEVGECPETLKSMGECIAKNCDGWPLAISLVASSLVTPVPPPPTTNVAKDLTEKLWKKVSDNVIMYITEYGSNRDVFKRLELSYTKLSRSLQNCFLYLGVFPEDHEISVWTLTRLWVAEELVQRSPHMSLEEIAEQNLCDLVDRNLVMVGKTYPHGQIKTCRLHKVIYGFCKYKAREQEFYQEIKMSRRGRFDSPISLTPKHRRLCIYSCLSEFLSARQKGRFVRSILCLEKEEKVLHPKYSSSIHKSFKLLKILEFRCVSFAKFSTKFSKLTNLKYMTLSCDDLDVVPEAFSSLYFLETLVLDTRLPSLDFKANIWKMYKLRHLLTKAAILLTIPLQETDEGGKDLQTLSRLAPECCTENLLRRAPYLRTLGIRGSLAAFSSAAFLSISLHLQHLKLINESAPESFRLDHLLPSYRFPPNLTRLTLSAAYLGWECMSVLGRIRTLEILKLKNNAFTGEYWNTDADSFPSLGFLFIGTADLVSWEASVDCFPSLNCLVLKNCEKLAKIPLTVGERLDTLDIENVSESAVESAREIEQQHKCRSHEFKLSVRLGSSLRT